MAKQGQFKPKFDKSEVEKAMKQVGIVESSPIRNTDFLAVSKSLRGVQVLDKYIPEPMALRVLRDPLTEVKDVVIDHMVGDETIMGVGRFNAHSSIKAKAKPFATLGVQAKPLRGNNQLLNKFIKGNKQLIALFLEIQGNGLNYCQHSTDSNPIDLKKDTFFNKFNTMIRDVIANIPPNQKEYMKAIDWNVKVLLEDAPNKPDQPSESNTLLDNGLSPITNVVLFYLTEVWHHRLVLDNLMANNQASALASAKFPKLHVNISKAASVLKARSLVSTLDIVITEMNGLYFCEDFYQDWQSPYLGSFTKTGNSDDAYLVPVLHASGNETYDDGTGLTNLAGYVRTALFATIEETDSEKAIWVGSSSFALSNLSDYFTGTETRIQAEVDKLDEFASDFPTAMEDLAVILEQFNFGFTKSNIKYVASDARKVSEVIFDPEIFTVLLWLHDKGDHKVPNKFVKTSETNGAGISAYELRQTSLDNDGITMKNEVPYFLGGHAPDFALTDALLPMINGAKVPFNTIIEKSVIYVTDENGDLVGEDIGFIDDEFVAPSGTTEENRTILNEIENLIWYYKDEDGGAHYNSEIKRIGGGYQTSLDVKLNNVMLEHIAFNSIAVANAAKSIVRAKNTKKAQADSAAAGAGL